MNTQRPSPPPNGATCERNVNGIAKRYSGVAIHSPHPMRDTGDSPPLARNLAADDPRDPIVCPDVEVDPGWPVVFRHGHAGPDDPDLPHDQNTFQSGGILPDQIRIACRVASIRSRRERRWIGRLRRACTGGKKWQDEQIPHSWPLSVKVSHWSALRLGVFTIAGKKHIDSAVDNALFFVLAEVIGHVEDHPRKEFSFAQFVELASGERKIFNVQFAF